MIIFLFPFLPSADGDGMKAQASLEYMALTLVSLSLLCVSVMALSGIKADSEKSFRMFAFKSSAQALSDAMDEVCAMGDGNLQTLSLSSPLSLETRRSDDNGRIVWLARFSHGNDSIVRDVLCEADDAALPTGAVHVENQGGKVSVR
jgi:hypothetical protein